MPTKQGTGTTRKRVTKKPPHPLAHLIPDPTELDEYERRAINGHEDLAILEYAHEYRKPVLITGPTGNGKTKMVTAFAASKKLPLVTVQSNGGVDPQTFWGGLIFPPGEQVPRWEDADPTQVVRHGGIVYINEVNMLHPRTAAAFYSLLDWRRQLTILENGNEHVDAHPDLMIVADMNPGYEGTRELNAAFRNRFPIKLETDYDPEIEGRLVYTDTVLELANELREALRAGDLTTPVSTNMLQEFEEFAVDFDVDFAIANFVSAFADDEQASVAERISLKRSSIERDVEEWLRESGILDDDDEGDDDADVE